MIAPILSIITIAGGFVVVGSSTIHQNDTGIIFGAMIIIIGAAIYRTGQKNCESPTEHVNN